GEDRDRRQRRHERRRPGHRPLRLTVRPRASRRRPASPIRRKPGAVTASRSWDCPGEGSRAPLSPTPKGEFLS
ncbi:MAG: hypothetical protein WAT81_00870, partial [Candidatus Moraniibacteriota bacterium]